MRDRITKLEPGESMFLAGYLVDGPSASGFVIVGTNVEFHIAELCNVNGDDPDDYTASGLYLHARPGPVIGARAILAEGLASGEIGADPGIEVGGTTHGKG